MVAVLAFLLLYSCTFVQADDIRSDDIRLIMRPPTRNIVDFQKRINPDSNKKIAVKQARKIVEGRVHEFNVGEDLVHVDSKCLLDASKRFRVPVSVILTILDVEGGEIGSREGNRNGTWDLGPMQVNTCHLPEVAGFGITKRDLENNGCLNIQVGTWLLRNHLNATGGNVLESVGRYHSRNQPYKSRYQAKAAKAYKTIKENPGQHISRILNKANGRI